ncbi:MAG: pyridoxamine 5'-phosphate oxidase, partial [Bacteroidota bacterium]
MKLDSLRNEYTYSGITRKNVSANPFDQFNRWMKQVIDSGEKEPTAMTLSTIGTDGFPHARIVLLKFVDEVGFTFFTNYNGEKAKAIELNNVAGLHFFWSKLERQVKILGHAEKVNREISEKYFRSRPAESQISAWASNQSEEIPSREYLEKRFEEFGSKFENKPVPLPPFWGGYRVIPQKIEFWQGRISRLHDR